MSQPLRLPSGGFIDRGTTLSFTFEGRRSGEQYFSPDGTKVAFAGLREGVWNVGWVSRDGEAERTVTSNRRLNSYVRYPAWSPAGDAIYYEVAETTGNIWLVEMAEVKETPGKAGGKP